MHARPPIATALMLAALASCSHSDPFAYTRVALGPESTGADVQLTFNPDQDYWPNWTEDGRGLLYAFVDPGAALLRRCVGLLPPAGGTRIWEFCDSRATQDDSTSSFLGYALGTDGRLLYAESVASSRFGAQITTTLWLADSARPFARTALATLPIAVAGVDYTSLTDIQWTGANSFTALAQLEETFPDCHLCPTQDTLFTDRGLVVTGTIVAGRTTFTGVAGTDGATAYSLAENGASVVFTRANDVHLFKTPIAGGTAAVVANVVADTLAGGNRQLVGVSCKGTLCVVANDPLVLTDPSVPVWPAIGVGPRALLSVTLGTGSVQLLLLGSNGIYASPRISPANGDVVAQVGGVWGHLQTYAAGGSSDLHRYPNMVP